MYFSWPTQSRKNYMKLALGKLSLWKNYRNSFGFDYREGKK